MPTVHAVATSSSSDDADLASSDEMKVFKDEGEEADERRSSADGGDDDPIDVMNDLKRDLIDEGEKHTTTIHHDLPSTSGHHRSSSPTSPFPSSTHHIHPASNPLGYFPFHHPPVNGSFSMGDKMASAFGSGSPSASATFSAFMKYQMEEGFRQPPPAHMGTIGQKTEMQRPMFPSSHQAFSPHSFWGSFYQMNPYSNPGSQLSAPYGPLRPFPFLGPLNPISHLNPYSSPHPSLSSPSQANGHHHPLLPSSTASSSGSGSSTSDQKSSPLSSSLSRMSNGTSASSVGTNSPSNVSLSASRLISSSSSSPGSSSESKCIKHLNGLGNHHVNNLNHNNNQNRHHLNQGSNSPSAVSSGHHHHSPSAVSSGHHHHSPSISSGHHHHSPSAVSSGHHHHSHHSNSSIVNNLRNIDDDARSVSSNNSNNMSHVKKPLNAFMLYMKEQRTRVVAEYTLKESAAINQILGKQWHNLSREEQQKYYEMARQERQKHQQLYPGWTARDNYAIHQRKKKKKRDKSADGEGGSLKKCRARFGLDQQSKWCKPCRRKKKCARFSEGNERTGSERDNLGSVGSTEAATPDSKSANESDGDNLNNLSPHELSLSSPPVPTHGDHHLVLPPHPATNGHHHAMNLHHQRLLQVHQHHHEYPPSRNSSNSLMTSSSSLASLSCPPRNSPIGPNNPLSIEQLTRPHRPALLQSS